MGITKKSKIKVKFRKLGKKKPNGKNSTPFGTFNTKTKLVEIDPRQTEDELMDTLFTSAFTHRIRTLKNMRYILAHLQLHKSFGIWDTGEYDNGHSRPKHRQCSSGL
jgi:hypothetical protein